MGVFTRDEAVAFLADRTGRADDGGAEAVAAELGYLPLALAQAAAVIAGQHLPYEIYLHRLEAVPVGEYLTREEGQPYTHGVAKAILLSLDAVRVGDPAGASIRVMEIMAVLSASGVRRELLYDAGRTGVLAKAKRRRTAKMSASLVDRTLAQLAEWSLLTFSLDDQAVIAHRLVMRVVRDGLAKQGRLIAVCRAVALVLNAHAEALERSQDRPAVRDIPEQVTALLDNTAQPADGADKELARSLLSLRVWALYYLNVLHDSALQAIAFGEPLITDLDRVLGPDHPSTLASRNNLAEVYQAAGRNAKAIPMFDVPL